MISFDEFKNVEMTIGKVTAAEAIEESDKLLRLEVDLGEETRQIVSGIREFVSADELIGTQVIIVANLEPRELFGFESQGMLLAAKTDDAFSLLGPHSEMAAGTRVS